MVTGLTLREDFEERGIKYQIIKGRIISNMAPLANPNHSRISNKINVKFSNYFEGKQCTVYHDNNYLRIDVIKKRGQIKLPEECKHDRFIPDVMVVCDKSIDTLDGVIGAPTLVVEVLSKTTKEYDISIKKEVYAQIGVKEYWIVDPFAQAIEIYVLENGVYKLHGIYYKYDEREIQAIEEDKEIFCEKCFGSKEIITEFSSPSFPDLIINIDDTFANLIE